MMRAPTQGKKRKRAPKAVNGISSPLMIWDDVKSVPQIMTRIPPSWLLCDEDYHDPYWGIITNNDIVPQRGLNQDELLAKAHFDQIMVRADPTYIEDTYVRGVWIRKSVQFTLKDSTSRKPSLYTHS